MVTNNDANESCPQTYKWSSGGGATLPAVGKASSACIYKHISTFRLSRLSCGSLIVKMVVPFPLVLSWIHELNNMTHTHPFHVGMMLSLPFNKTQFPGLFMNAPAHAEPPSSLEETSQRSAPPFILVPTHTVRPTELPLVCKPPSPLVSAPCLLASKEFQFLITPRRQSCPILVPWCRNKY